eukprot:3531614-Pleurochrysis_carterae.AAC.1
MASSSNAAPTLPTQPFISFDAVGGIPSAIAPQHHRNSQFRQWYATGSLSHDEYTQQMYALAAEFYESVPRGVRRQAFTFTLRMVFDDSPADLPEQLQGLNLPLRCQTLKEALSEEPVPVRNQYDHRRTRLPLYPMDAREHLQVHRIPNLVTLCDVIFTHLTFRERLRELYDPESGIDHDLEEGDRAIYHVPNFVVFTATRSTLDPSETHGDRSSHLFRELLLSNDDAP